MCRPTAGVSCLEWERGLAAETAKAQSQIKARLRTHFFDGHWSSAEKQIRAWAWFHHLWPYCLRARMHQTYQSPIA